MISQVSPGIYRGPRPEHFIDLVGRKIKTVLSLEGGWYEFFRGRLYEEDQLAREAGAEVIHVRLSNLLPPSRDQVSQCLEILTRHHHARPIYVHCRHGVDRTGFICAAYRVVIQRWTVEEAIEEWTALGFHAWFHWYWLWVFRRMMRRWL